MGSGAETARGTAAALQREGQKVGVLQVRLYRPFAATRLLAALPHSAAPWRCSSKPRSPARPGEPLYLDVVDARWPRRLRTGSAQTMPRVDRRPLRPVLEGLRSRHGQGRVRRTDEAGAAAMASRSASMTMSPTPASRSTRASRSSRTKWCARCSTASARMARSAPTRTA